MSRALRLGCVVLLSSRRLRLHGNLHASILALKCDEVLLRLPLEYVFAVTFFAVPHSCVVQENNAPAAVHV